MLGAGYHTACENSLELRAAFQPLHAGNPIAYQPRQSRNLDSQALAALGAARSDHSPSAAGFHAGQKSVRACAFDFGGLVGAFHGGSCWALGESKGLPPTGKGTKPQAAKLAMQGDIRFEARPQTVLGASALPAKDPAFQRTVSPA
jgi:hypothetical protein